MNARSYALPGRRTELPLFICAKQDTFCNDGWANRQPSFFGLRGLSGRSAAQVARWPPRVIGKLRFFKVDARWGNPRPLQTLRDVRPITSLAVGAPADFDEG